MALDLTTAIVSDLAGRVLASSLVSMQCALVARSPCWLGRADQPSLLPPRATLSDTVRSLEHKLLGESRASTIRGELAIGRGSSRHTLVFGRSRGSLTMMQSCASAAKLRGGGPILENGVDTMACFGWPPPRIVIGDRRCPVRQVPRACPVRVRPSRRSQDNASWHLARGRHSPQRDQQLSREGHDQGLARAAPSICRARPVPLRQRTLPLMKQKTPGQLDHPAADAGVARLGEPFLAPPAAALVR